MKRILIVLGLIAPMFLMGLPAANATVYGERCYTFIGPSGNHAVQFCASLGSDGTKWWARAEAHTVPGYGSINTAVANLYYFSRDANNNICWGDLSYGAHSCEGHGSKIAFNMVPPNNGATLHYANSDHYCTSWANLSVLFTYVQGGQQYSTGDLNSWAVTTPPCAS